MTSLLFASRCARMAPKSSGLLPGPFLLRPLGSEDPDCSAVMMYLWKRSVPADRAMGFGTEAFSVDVDDSIRASVSDTVEGGEAERRAVSDSMAATGLVIS